MIVDDLSKLMAGVDMMCKTLSFFADMIMFSSIGSKNKVG